MTVLLSDPRIAAITARETGEPLVDAAEVPELRADADPPGSLVRQGVLERLLVAQAALPAGLRLLIHEGYRSPGVQHRYFSDYREQLRARYPGWTGERLHTEASKFVSPPDVAPHCTGGAVDLTLATATGARLDMGTAINASPEASANACYTAATSISPEARSNRDMLAAALAGAGLINYPTEWWHWSYGERYWAYTTGRPATVYAAVSPREHEERPL
ncbi:M15 family metallopeptidase [Amycolatopsis alkalitolerans]|nr:M15 family metallopeptidase [Amycolatopsis alkalitolerans]